VRGQQLDQVRERLWPVFAGTRQISQLSLRQLAGLAKVSDAYLSQIERGLHFPSVGIIRSLAESLKISTEDLLA
jgi:transcriptional regulator with XRE-family HTH domain